MQRHRGVKCGAPTAAALPRVAAERTRAARRTGGLTVGPTAGTVAAAAARAQALLISCGARRRMHAGRSGHVFVFCPARLFVALPPLPLPNPSPPSLLCFSLNLSSHTRTQPTRTRCACSAVQVDDVFSACAGSAVCGCCCGFLAGCEGKGRKPHSTRGSALWLTRFPCGSRLIWVVVAGPLPVCMCVWGRLLFAAPSWVDAGAAVRLSCVAA
ncbi:uncharacterized protein Tco025E_08825 [Trypanosoma conorhini]|uniref:Uncharacterized protein n=1 Tax=Trypanosoma conorhini TaxID=83891 RepID=A0A3R7LNE8_9TRYP|nr:uncharacterized protein Tco025E_08825 [Trypanosoma conorhini]RNF00329.1 hypothetical protein Tco025E_08825 [Trypanosoma conorhini]